MTLVLTPDSITEVNEQSTVTATLNHPSSEATTVTVSVAPVSPAVAGDYTLSTNRVLTIAAGSDDEHGHGDGHEREQHGGRTAQDGDGVGYGDEQPGGDGPGLT